MVKSSKASKNAAPIKSAKAVKPVKVAKPTKAQTANHEEEVLITQEGLDALKKELNELKTTRRKEVAQRLKEAISYGDLSENAEYEEARNEQSTVEGRIVVLEQQIKNAKVISDTHKHVKTVQVGHTITLYNTQSKQEEVYTIVGSTEADPLEGRISNESPVGKGSLGKGVGDKIDISVPEGRATYEIRGVD
jgi:transcription elongation factor GreA